MHADIQLVRRNPYGKGLPRVVLLLLLCVCAGPCGAAAGEPVGKVDSLTGKVTVERAGRTVPAETGAEVYLQDKLRTMVDSSVEIVFKDESRVKMAADTMLEITEYLYNPAEKKRESLLSMVSGKARFVVADLQDFKQKRFRVQTQTSVVGTRDTDFSVWVVSELLTKSLCLENVIMFVNRQMPGKPVLLTANMVSEVYGANLPAVPRFATAAERREFMKGLESMGGRGDSSRKRGAQESGEDKADTGETTGTGTTSAPTTSPGLLPTLPTQESIVTTVRGPTITNPVPTTTRPTVPTTTSTSRPTLPPPPPPPN